MSEKLLESILYYKTFGTLFPLFSICFICNNDLIFGTLFALFSIRFIYNNDLTFAVRNTVLQ